MIDGHNELETIWKSSEERKKERDEYKEAHEKWKQGMSMWDQFWIKNGEMDIGKEMGICDAIILVYKKLVALEKRFDSHAHSTPSGLTGPPNEK